MSTQKIAGIFIKVFYGVLVISFLSFAIPFAYWLTSKDLQPSYFMWGVGYANFYVLWPLLILSFIGLIILNYKLYGASRGTERISLLLVILSIAILLVYLGSKELKYKNNQLEVVFKNNTSKPIKYIDLYGRGALTELDSLAPFTDSTVIFRGKAILRQIENPYDNEVSLRYYFDSTYFRQPVLKGFGKWTVFNGPFQLDFYGPDSVEFKYLPRKTKP